MNLKTFRAIFDPDYDYTIEISPRETFPLLEGENFFTGWVFSINSGRHIYTAMFYAIFYADYKYSI